MTTGVLLCNLGSPDSPSPSAVRKYLAQFLSDPRVVEIPGLFWLPFLYGIVLPFRARKTAKLYQKIWTAQGSPLKVILEGQVQKLQTYFFGKAVYIEGAMRYGHPSIAQGIKTLIAKDIRKLIVLPLYPQYAAATTASTFDEVARIFKTLRFQPELHMVNGYYQNNLYIAAVAESIKIYWAKEGQTQQLLFSFHGLPRFCIAKGDPYEKQCRETAAYIAAQLSLEAHQWQIAFQSRFGKTQWLEPYTDKLLRTFPTQGIKTVTVVCPGFSADCLETLEEINHYNRQLFMKAGGKIFHYVPALNAQTQHIEVLVDIIEKYL